MTLAPAALASLISLTIPAASAATEPAPRIAAGDRMPVAPPILLADLTGRTVDLNGEVFTVPGGKRRTTLLVFWATWCQPCIHEVPDLNELHRYYGKDGFRVVGIGVGGGDDPPALADAVSRLGISYPVWFDRQGSAARAFQVRALPASALVDGDGIVRWIGTRLPRDINERIKKAIEPAEDGE